MTVYVDDMRASFGRMVMCHMIADTLTELLTMADRIGVARKWLQSELIKPHFDIALSKRALAVKYGAREITLRQCACMSTYRVMIANDQRIPNVWDVPLPPPEEALRLISEFRSS
jgi:hypothetical protein